MEKYYICEECEIPMDSEADYGINKDGSKNTTYCITCWNKNKSLLLKFAYFLDYFDWLLVGIFIAYGVFFAMASPLLTSILLVFSLFFTIVCTVTVVLVNKHENYYRRKRHLVWAFVQCFFWLSIDVFFILILMQIIYFNFNEFLMQFV